MSAHFPKVIICIIIALLLSCTSFFMDSFDNINESLETSNKVLIDSNIKIYTLIRSCKIRDTSKALTVDSLLYANDEASELINQFKEEIRNLKLLGRENEHAQELFASPFTFAPLMEVIANVDERTSRVMNSAPGKLKLDSILVTARSLRTDSLWRKKNIEGASVSGILVVLSGLQMSCSNATNLALSEIQQSISKHP